LPLCCSQTKELLDKAEAIQFDFEGEEWEGVSVEARAMVSGLLQVVPAKRLNVDQALLHPWMAMVQDEGGGEGEGEGGGEGGTLRDDGGDGDDEATSEEGKEERKGGRGQQGREVKGRGAEKGDLDSDEEKEERAWAQCSKCGKWRLLAKGKEEWRGVFHCDMNSWDENYSRCDAAEDPTANDGLDDETDWKGKGAEKGGGQGNGDAVELVNGISRKTVPAMGAGSGGHNGGTSGGCNSSSKTGSKLEDLTVPELKQVCRSATLPVGGTKTTLIERLRAHESGTSLEKEGGKDSKDSKDSKVDKAKAKPRGRQQQAKDAQSNGSGKQKGSRRSSPAPPSASATKRRKKTQGQKPLGSRTSAKH
jgi:hypothetical protein